MTTGDSYNVKSAQECIKKSLQLIDQARKHDDGEGAKESNIRHSFTSYLRLIFPTVPWWVEDHISRGEANSAFSVAGKPTHGFVDNLVGLTAIEYETDLENKPKFIDGLRQVKNYCAALLNKGHAQELIVGVLSDTIRWRAYRVKSIAGPGGMLGGEHLELEEIEQLDLSSADEIAANRLVGFLIKYLGRRASRPLSATTIAKDLGFESVFCKTHADSLLSLVDKAFKTNPKYAELIAKLWCSFVTYLRDKGAADSFEKRGYADEVYILTLAKLICANVIEKKALTSTDAELQAILDGDYFRSKGLANVVEYDYFGWLNNPPFVSDILPVARGLQSDLEAYDFASSTIEEDLFGRLMAQLARRTQRILLGQEWTPAWLARRLVGEVVSKLPKGTDLQLVDMCCGSGAMVVEGVRTAKKLIGSTGSALEPEQKIQKLSEAITGFDIDPLAVMLSKISWVLAARDWLEPFDGSLSVSIPIYHADSLFAATPLSHTLDKEEHGDSYGLQIAEHKISLPSFLLSPQFQPLFDAVLTRAYAMVMTASATKKLELPQSTISAAVESARADSGCALSAEQSKQISAFLPQLVAAVDALNRDGRNGIWAFLLRNSYRPSLVAGQFNGLVSNPPWLALSKIADNPYKEALGLRAEAFGIKPEGPSHLHIELATIFLLHAIDRYLQADAAIGCIVPDTVLNGHHHNPFRLGTYSDAKHPVDFTVDKIWRVQKGTFKNEACVLFGRRKPFIAGTKTPIPGAVAKDDGLSLITFERIERGNRVVWSDNPAASAGKSGFFDPAPFRQGADVMPRTLVFHELSPLPAAAGRVQWSAKPIDKSTSKLAFVIKDAKKHKDFKITPRTVPDDFVFDVVTSNLLTPFELVAPLKGLLPIRKNSSNDWSPVTPMTLAANPAAKASFDEILKAFGSSDLKDYFAAIDSDRKKLTQQHIPSDGFLVFTGAGGKIVCAAHAPISAFTPGKLIVDQTLYWAPVATEDEALYLSGALNSDSVNRVIQEFQPRGAFGERHVHTLAHEATPKYDPDQVAHQEVVDATRQLLLEYSALKGSSKVLAKLLDPNKTSLAVRRRQIGDLIKHLPSYEAYELACSNLYGVELEDFSDL